MLVFTGICLGVGAIAESVSLRTGLPYGSYYFTDLMGPKLLQVPILLVLAYLGVGYLSWVLATLILGYANRPLAGVRLVVLPLIASFVMVAWDLAMDPVWATIDHAWIWRSGGSYFGVPISNFLGWYLTAFCFYQLFAVYVRSVPIQPRTSSRGYWFTAVLFYGICAAGNLLLARSPMVPHIVIDPSGRPWMTTSIFIACALISTLVMGPITLLSWLRLKAATSSPDPS